MTQEEKKKKKPKTKTHTFWCAKLFKRLFNRKCKHEFISDTQITVIWCKKCNEQYWYKYGVLFDSGITKHEINNKVRSSL